MSIQTYKNESLYIYIYIYIYIREREGGEREWGRERVRPRERERERERERGIIGTRRVHLIWYSRRPETGSHHIPLTPSMIFIIRSTHCRSPILGTINKYSKLISILYACMCVCARVSACMIRHFQPAFI